MKIDWGGLDFAKETLQELLDEFRSNRLAIYQDGLWKDQSVMKVFEYDFGTPFGKQYCAPMFLPELEDLARQIPGLRETGFYVTGFNRVPDYLVLPIITLALRILPRTADPVLARFLQWGLQFGRPPFGIELVADCQGQHAGETAQLQLRLSHEDGYVMTAAPVVACLIQAFDGDIVRPGLHRQALIVDPDRFLKDIARMGIRVSEKGASLPALS
jgi:saccharopine dehydrogenase (NAD+, L-lysine-forming)